MENIIYKANYSDKKYFKAIKEQEDMVINLISNNNFLNYRIIESNLLQDIHSFDRKLDVVIKSMKEYDCLVINHLNVLGNSPNRILKRVYTLYSKNCSLHMIQGNIRIKPDDTFIPMQFLVAIAKFGNALNGRKKEAMKLTLQKSGKKPGRVAGKKYASKFDPHKNKIMKMHSKRISKNRICEIIGIGTPQAIGKYIKSLNEQSDKKQNKQKKDKTYISTKMINPEKLSEPIGFQNIDQR